MADPIIEIDAAGSALDGSNPGSALTITTGNYGLLSLESPAPTERVQWASSVDTEGSLPAAVGHDNRTVTITLDVVGASALNALTGKIAKLHREGGTLKHTGKNGTVVIADVLATNGYAPNYDLQRLLGDVTTVQFTLPAKPYLRGTESELGTDTVEATLPYVVKTVTGPAGDWYAIGRLLIDNDQAIDQWWLTWGLESRYYSASANADLFYQAEGRTAQGGSATAVGPSGASGAGSNVMRNTSLQTGYQSILSTQATGGGAHLSHVGTFRAYARMQTPTTNSGDVTIALEWAEGDFLAYTRNQETTLAGTTAEGKWFLVDLGLVSPQKVIGGTQRWEGRILARSSVAGDDIDVDYLLFIPVAEGSGVVEGVTRYETPTSFSGRDEFNQTAGALSGKTAITGGNWVTAGSATDLTVTGSGAVTRSVGTDASPLVNGRLATLDLNLTATAVQVDATVATGIDTSTAPGVIARYVDSSNFLRAYRLGNVMFVQKMIAASQTTLAQVTIPTVLADTAYRIRLVVDTAGRWWVWHDAASAVTARSPIAYGQDSVLATGGTLATGDAGFSDFGGNSTTKGRTYDNFVAWVPAFDAAVYASQSIEIRHDRLVREDSGGTLWVRPSSYVGDYLLVPPAGAESRSVRVIAKTARTDPTSEGDPSIDDVSMRLFAIPRYLTFPD